MFICMEACVPEPQLISTRSPLIALQVALDVFAEMLKDGCIPNLVTYHTLIDVSATDWVCGRMGSSSGTV